MRVLVLGSGAKDHAIAWWFSRSKLIDGLFIAPGNIGTERIGTNLSTVDPANPEDVYKACKKYKITYVFIGTEAPLQTGMVDYLNERGINTFGAPAHVLKLEGDRTFSREFCKKYHIPTPDYRIFTDELSLSQYLKKQKKKHFVVKRNTISPSRLMISSADYATLMAFSKTMLQKGPIVLEDYIPGPSLTISVLVDSAGNYCALPTCFDYTKTESGEKGIATGGMGSICPVPLGAQTKDNVFASIILPTLEGLKKEQLAYKGVLTFSIIITENGPVLVDYHIRFNDPATQAIVPLMNSDLAELLQAMEQNKLSEFQLQISEQSSVAVVVASKGYPRKPQTGITVNQIPSALGSNMLHHLPQIFYGAVVRNGDAIVTSGGRCITVVGLGNNILEANHRAYEALGDISFDGSWYRSDIGNKFFEDTPIY